MSKSLDDVLTAHLNGIKAGHDILMKREIKALMLEIIGDDDSIKHAGNTAQFNSIMGRNMLREEQRKRVDAA